MVSAQQRFRRGPLQKGSRLRVNRSAQKIVGRRIADVELDRRIKRGEFHEVRLEKIAGFRGRMICERLLPKLREILDRREAEKFRRQHPQWRAA